MSHPAPPMRLQNTYINDKLLASTVSCSYSISKPVQEYQSVFQISFELRLATTLKASNIFHVECKTKS